MNQPRFPGISPERVTTPSCAVDSHPKRAQARAVTLRIVPTTEPLLAGFHAAVDAVARERRYLNLVAAPPFEETTQFVRNVLASGGVQFLALSATNEVVGWSDVARARLEGMEHSGRFGMGLLPQYRHQGHGRPLAEAAISAARTRGIERVELDVFASNLNAIRLYERLGFVHEGIKRRARKLDGEYEDHLIMALLFTLGGG